MDVYHGSVIASSIFCGSSLLLITSLIKEPHVVLVFDVLDELLISLMVKSIYPLSVLAESSLLLLGVAALD